MSIRKILLASVITAAFAQTVGAQSVQHGNVTASVGASALVYLGDLTPNRFGDINTARPGIQVAAMVPVSKNLGIKGCFTAGSLEGDDKRYDGWRPLRSFSFKSDIREIAVMAQWEFRGQSWNWDEENRYTSDFKVKTYKRFSPYFFAGVGYLSNTLTRHMSGIDSNYFYGDVAWTNYGQESKTVYKSGMLVAPVGIGTHILLSRSIRCYAEYSYHAVFNDYLDGFATAVVSKKPDAYQTFTIGLDFRFLKYGSRRRNEICNLNL